MTSRREFFSSYTPGNFGDVRMRNEDSSKVTEKGDVCLKTENGIWLVLRDVRYIPDMHLNLISTGRVDDEGYCNTIYNGQWKLTKGSLVVSSGKKYSKLYMMQAKLF